MYHFFEYDGTRYQLAAIESMEPTVSTISGDEVPARDIVFQSGKKLTVKGKLAVAGIEKLFEQYTILHRIPKDIIKKKE